MTDEWITVSEYAARRRLSERQARRIVAVLPEDLRSKPEERPAKVKWCPATSGSASPTSRMAGMSGEMSEESAVLDAIGADQPRPGADRWQDCPADVRQTPDTLSDAQFQALTKTLVVLQDQLAKKDATIDELTATVRELTGLVDQAQQLHRSDQLERAALKQIEPPKRTWFQLLLASWKDQRIDQ